MSGHSKWSKVKHQKAVTDAVKGKIFTKMANAIINSIVAGGGNTDSNTNFKLRLAVEKARSLNMPKEKIERAIERASGSSGEDVLEEAMYEGFGPGGVGIIIETLSNNRQRTVSELKNLLERGGGALAAPGSVSHLFMYLGLIRIGKNNIPADNIIQEAIAVGAEDVEDEEGIYDIYIPTSKLHKAKMDLENKGFHIISSELYFKPVTSIAVLDKQTAQNVLRLLNSLEQLEDVQKVFANFDIPDEIMGSI